MARRFVRVAGVAARQAAAAPTAANPNAVAVKVVARAIREQAGAATGGDAAIGSSRRAAGPCHCRGARGGKWIRRGRKIVLLGA
jgi:hypothetical protein